MANRSLIGRASRADGALFEEWIENALFFYREQGVASIEKTPEPMKILKPHDRRKGHFIATFAKKAQPDFKGVLCDGRCIIFDAKHTEKDRILQSAVSEEQWKVFDQYKKMYACCYVVVSLGFRSFYRVPWNVWKKMKEMFGHKYMSETDLENYKVPTIGNRILILEGIELNEEVSNL